jgi:transposase
MRYDLTDFEWERFQTDASARQARSAVRGRLPGLERHLPGAPWRDLPNRYRAYRTAYNRFNRWRKASVWDRLMEAVTKAHDGKLQMIDSSIVRVHQYAAGAKKGVEIV